MPRTTTPIKQDVVGDRVRFRAVKDAERDPFTGQRKQVRRTFDTYDEAVAWLDEPRPLILTYGRGYVKWRVPIFHVVRTLAGDARRAYWECGSNAEVLARTLTPEVPSGYELCQRCAYALNERLHRTSEIVTPDRARHQSRTLALLNA